MQKTDVCTASNSPQTVHRALAGDEMLYCRTLPLEDLEAGDEGCGLGNWALGGSAMVWRDCSRGQCATVSMLGSWYLLAVCMRQNVASDRRRLVD